MQYKKFESRVLSSLLMAGLIAACQQGQESPPQIETSLPRLSDFQHEITLNESLQSMRAS